MLTVCGKIQSASKSRTGKSVSVNVGGTWVHVNNDDIETFKDAIGKGDPIEVRVRTDLELDEDGAPKMRTFKKRDGSNAEGPDIRCRFWYRAPGGDSGLSELIGVDAKAGSADAE